MTARSAAIASGIGATAITAASIGLIYWWWASIGDSYGAAVAGHFLLHLLGPVLAVAAWVLSSEIIWRLLKVRTR
jgi:hypothetical protein